MNIHQNLSQWFKLEDNHSAGMFPHLCNGMSVFALVLAGELIAFALVLVNSSLSSFPWARLGYVSMVVQWIVLLSALVLCQLSVYLDRMSALIPISFQYV